MSTLSPPSTPCLDPNPDISGIGVRASIYVQAFLNIICAVVFSRDTWFSRTEHTILTQTSLNLFLVGCALLVCTVVQRSTFGITVHHALLVLNLNWIVGLSALLYVLIWTYSFVARMVRVSKEECGDPCEEDDRGSEYIPSGVSLLILSTIHLCGTGALGVWLWSTISSFGDQPECTPVTLYTFFGRNLHVVGQAESKVLRGISLVVYGMIALPFINLLIVLLVGLFAVALLALAYAPIAGLVGTKAMPPWKTCLLFTGILIVALLDILFIVDTELMISRTAVIGEGEGQWSFGQTLALVALIVPLLDTVKMLWRSTRERVDKQIRPPVSKVKIQV